MDWATIVLDILTLLIVIASFIAIYVNHKQTQKALAIAHEQIEQSKQPILIPISPLPLTAVVGELDFTVPNLSLDLRNVGTGVALNIWGALERPQNVQQRPFSFSNQSHLIQDKEIAVIFRMGQFFSFIDNDKIGEYNLWPSSDLTGMAQGGNAKRLKYACRLTLTYIDVFDIKHATIYDLTCDNEWKFVKHFRIPIDLEDIYNDKKNSTP